MYNIEIKYTTGTETFRRNHHRKAQVELEIAMENPFFISAKVVRLDNAGVPMETFNDSFKAVPSSDIPSLGELCS